MFDKVFELEKAVQSINYIIFKLKLKSIDKLDALKLIFLADRYHLRKYGRTITNDDYWAMTYGPVASSVKDIIEIGSYLSKPEKKYTERFLAKVYTHQIKSIAAVDMDALSETDIEALDAAIKQKRKHANLVEFTHLFPEWKKHESNISTLGGRVRMDMADCFCDAPPKGEYCDVPPEMLKLNKEHYQENLIW